MSGKRVSRVVEAWREISGSRASCEAELLTGGRHATVIHLRPADRSGQSVVAKLMAHGELELERSVHEVVLPELGVETPRFLGFHPGEADEGDVLFLEYVGPAKFLPSEPAHQAAAARWLGTCHAASARTSIPAVIPRRSVEEEWAELSATRSRLAATLGNPMLGAEGERLVIRVLELLHRATEHWPEWAQRTAAVPQVLTHGAFITRNVRVRGEGVTLVTLPFDWDHAAVRSPAVDMARTQASTRSFAANASLVEYRTALGDNGVVLESGVVADVASMGTVIRAVACIGWLISTLAGPDVEESLKQLRLYRQTLEGVLST